MLSIVTKGNFMSTRRNQAGFAVLEIFVLVLLIAGIGAVGWYVWRTHHKKDTVASVKTNTSASEKSKADATQYVVPKDYVVFKDTTLGFSFAYPGVFGDFGEQKTDSGVSYRTTENVKSFGEGISGSFTLYSYGSAQQSITSRKYGPQISLQNDKWIVTEANEADVTHNKVGDEYKDINGNILDRQTNAGLSVYTLISGDEGIDMDSLAFVAKGKLYVLALPEFDNGGYSGVTHDKTSFTTLLTNVRDSIRLAD